MNRTKQESVLFLCTGNSCRSQMAEAILRHEAADRFEALSAGLEPKPIHPLTLQVLKEINVLADGLYPKSTATFMGRVSIHHAIFVCEKAQRACPRIYPFALHTHSWPFEDPAAFSSGDPDQVLAKFREVRDQIRQRILHWLTETSELSSHPGTP